MSYAITFDVPLAPRATLRERMAAVLATTAPGHRVAEEQSARARALTRKPGQPIDQLVDLLAELEFAETRARDSARKAEQQAEIATQAALVLRESSPENARGAAEALAAARASAKRTLETALDHEAKALAAHARATEMAPPERTMHIAPTFDEQIEAGIDSAVLLARTIKSASTLRVQIAGHIEDIGRDSHMNVHVWPVP